MKRKIVQIVIMPGKDEYSNNYLYALCNDNTVWYYSWNSECWVKITDQIPQE